ncbi:MAG TPA: D-alanyl-D-alanine carboxypeptidase family protein, partial [Bacillota bacterium]|nr:D-alanyl-D-alanine carboxypeptidase family protein [Bacillota bacterium]
MKRVCLIALLLLFTIPTAVFSDDTPDVNSVAAVLMDAANGTILYSKNSQREMAPASTTKIMTAILAIEKSDLNSVVTVSANAAGKPETKMHLHKGEKIVLKDLLYGLLLSSGNDAATAIAEFISGSEDKFARLMTQKAKEIGMKDTQFKNASGLPAVNHYSTAYDLAVLARYALNNSTFAGIVQTKTASIADERSKYNLTNHNKLLWQYEFATGIKTGYTQKAGNCLVASANREGINLISVVLKSKSTYQDSIKLFENGFSQLMSNSNNS